MPPSRAAPLTSSFSVSDENNVVVCPLRNHDSSACRKRCTGVSLHERELVTPRHPTPRSSLVLPQLPTNPPCVGEALSLYARAHSTCSPRALHFQASSNRGTSFQNIKNLVTSHADIICSLVGKLSVNGQYTTARTSSSSSYSDGSGSATNV